MRFVLSVPIDVIQTIGMAERELHEGRIYHNLYLGGLNMKKIASLLLTAIVASSVAACTPTTTTTTAAGTTPGTTAAGTTAAGTTTAGTTAAGTTTPSTTTPSTTTPATTPTVADPKATITVQGEGPWKPYYEAAIATLKTKFPASTITLVEVGAFPNLDTIDKTDATNKDVPDVFAVPADRLPSMINKEALAALPAEEMAAALGGYTDFKSVGSILMDGEDYLAFPMNIETLITFVNPANAKTLGIDLTKPFEVKDQKGTELGVQAFNAWFGVAFTNAAGIDLLGKDDAGKFTSDMTKDWAELGADKQGVITELFNYWKRVYAKNPQLWDVQAAGGKISESFKDGGEVAYIIDGPWATPDLVKSVPGLDVLPLSQITVNGLPLKHWQGLWGLGVNSRLEGDKAKMTLATELIKELVNPANAEDFFKATGKIMANVPAEDYEKSGLSAIEKKTIAAVIESFKTSENRPLFAEWGGVWDTWQNAMISWNNTKPADAEAAFKALQDSFKAMMGNLGQ